MFKYDNNSKIKMINVFGWEQQHCDLTAADHCNRLMSFVDAIKISTRQNVKPSKNLFYM